MNLHSIASAYIGAVNPLVTVNIRVSSGAVTNADFTKSPGYQTPGSLTASIGGTFTASASGTTLTVSAVLSGTLQVNDQVSGSDGTNALPAGCSILSQLSGTPGGVGTYELGAATSPGDLGSCEVTSLSNVLNVTAVSGGVLASGQTLSDQSSELAAKTLITGQLSGSTGGIGLYTVSVAQTIASEAMATALLVTAQVQALSGRDLRQIEGLNLQGALKAIYVNGDLSGAVRVTVKGGDLITMPDNSVWLVTQVVEPWNLTAGWTKAVITLQDGS